MLKHYGVAVWYDKFILKPGDSLSEKIDIGISDSRYGIVVLSKIFFQKYWTRTELKSFRAMESLANFKIIPIWYDISKDEVAKFSPYLADMLSIVIKKSPQAQDIFDIIEIIRPDIFEFIHLKMQFSQYVGSYARINPEEINKGLRLHKGFSVAVHSRLRLLQACLQEVDQSSIEEWIDNFSRDLHPHKELLWWEFYASFFFKMKLHFPDHKDTHEEIYIAIFHLLMGNSVPINDLITKNEKCDKKSCITSY